MSWYSYTVDTKTFSCVKMAIYRPTDNYFMIIYFLCAMQFICYGIYIWIKLLLSTTVFPNSIQLQSLCDFRWYYSLIYLASLLDWYSKARKTISGKTLKKLTRMHFQTVMPCHRIRQLTKNFISTRENSAQYPWPYNATCKHWSCDKRYR